jgi:hypothetical protein
MLGCACIHPEYIIFYYLGILVFNLLLTLCLIFSMAVVDVDRVWIMKARAEAVATLRPGVPAEYDVISLYQFDQYLSVRSVLICSIRSGHEFAINSTQA